LQKNDLKNSTKKCSASAESVYYDQDAIPLRGTSEKVKGDKLSRSLQESDLGSRRKCKNIERESSLSPDVSNASRKSIGNLSRSLQEKDLKNSQRKISWNQLEEKSNRSSLSPILPARRTSQGRNSHDEEDLHENDSSLANSDVFERNKTKQNRLLPRPNMAREKTRRKSSPGTFYEDESSDQSCDFLRRSSDGRLSKSGKNNRSRFKHTASDGNLSKSQESKSLSPKLSDTTSSGNNLTTSRRKSGGSSFDEDRNFKTRNSPLIRLTSVDSDGGEFEQDPDIPLHHSFSTIDDFKSKNNPTRLTVSASAADLRTMQVKFDSNLNSGSEPNLTSTPKAGLMGSFNGLQSWFKERRVSKPGAAEASGDSNSNVMEESSTNLHLYMILDDTVMLAHLHSTWDNCLLVSFCSKFISTSKVFPTNTLRRSFSFS
jgi:hypothetical protein